MFEELKPLHKALGGLDAAFVHIAGSKGKGTSAYLLAKILELHGQKTGLFTSPGVFCHEEMIQIDGKPVTTKTLNNLLERVRDLAQEADLALSEFEEMTLAAYLHFQEEKVKYAVVECGWGGKEDATNIVENKTLTLLTHVEMEHKEILGDTLEKITKNKLGICRPGVPLLTLATQAEEVLRTIRESEYQYQIAPSYEVGHHHPESAGLAVMAADMLGYAMDSVIHEALVDMVIPGRFEVLELGPHTLILEGAHTFDSIKFFLERLRIFIRENGLPEPKFGIHILEDKEPDLWKLFPSNRTSWIPLSDPRAGEKPASISEEKLDTVLFNLKCEHSAQLLVFCGSFKLAGNVKRNIL